MYYYVATIEIGNYNEKISIYTENPDTLASSLELALLMLTEWYLNLHPCFTIIYHNHLTALQSMKVYHTDTGSNFQ